MTIAINGHSVRALTVAAIAATVMGIVSFQAAGAGERKPVEHIVEIKDFQFDPAGVSVRPGDTITWINRDIAPHTATAKDKSWDTSTIKRGESKSMLVKLNMSADYYCRFHPAMKATFKVVFGD